MASLPNYEDLNRAQLSNIYTEVEVAEELAYCALEIRLKLLVLQASHADGTHARDVDVAIAIDYGAVVDIDRAPRADQKFVTGSDYVGGGNGHAVDWRKRRWNFSKK